MPQFETETPEGLRRFLRGEGTGKVPCTVGINGRVWDQDPERFERLVEEAPDVHVVASRDPSRAEEHTWTDPWGCLWRFPGDYLDGQVIGHPLADWDAFAGYTPPDPAEHRDWDAFARDAEQKRQAGKVVSGGLPHGFLYLQLTYLRGFSGFMMDLAERRPEAEVLRDMVADYYVEVVRRYLRAGADLIGAGDDLGHQTALPMSPGMWRDFLKPAFARIFAPCREAGAVVRLHTDGFILPIIGDLIEIGVDSLNPQDLVNGLENLEKLAKGKLCIDLDIDRQSVTAFGTPEQIDAHIRECIQTLGSPGGRLTLIFGAYPGTPVENVARVALSMQQYHDIWAS